MSSIFKVTTLSLLILTGIAVIGGDANNCIIGCGTKQQSCRTKCWFTIWFDDPAYQACLAGCDADLLICVENCIEGE